MYVTKPLSLYRKYPNALSDPPPEGPNSGYLVIQDEEAVDTCCFGLCQDTRIRDLPFPQNKEIKITYTSTSTSNDTSTTTTRRNDVVLIPVLNQPLSSNRYYTIESHGKHKGEAYANSKEEDKCSCLCFRFVQDKKPAPLNPNDIYQQFVIHSYETCTSSGYFYAKSVAPDGYPPRFLKRKGWTAYTKTSKYFCLDEAQGLNVSLRSRLPDFSFDTCRENLELEVVVVGKWYCPFMFVQEVKLRDQMKVSMYYEMTLQQRWERIHSCENDQSRGNRVEVDVNVQNEAISIGGREALDSYVENGVMWIKGFSDGGEEKVVGLSLVTVERIKWEQERVGWVHVDGGQVRIQRVEEFKDVGQWKRFGCYVLVETFVLKRMNGSMVLAYEFKHTHQVKCKWE